MPDPRPRCAAVTRRGAPCRRYALPGSSFCRQHQPGSEPPAGGPFAGLFTPEELAALNAVGGKGAIDEIMQVLFVAIRRALANGSPTNVVVRACEAYVRALKEQQRMRSEAGDEIEEAWDRALDQLSGDLGIEL